MKLRTELHIPLAPFAITHKDAILAIGSCFADCMGARLADHKFHTLSNPFGNIFNPIAISNLLEKSIRRNESFNLVHSHGIWQAYECHSELGNPDRDILLDNLTRQINLTHQQLEKAKVLIITLGTAVVYEERSLNLIVANCHKMPAVNFEKSLLTSQTITTHLAKTIALIYDKYPELNIILTVSPIRHIKETIPLNMVSKSILRIACHELESKIDKVHYFPSYEIMMDDLRDYRFYKEDLIHPNTTAETYIWNKFIDSFCPDKTKTLLHKWDKVNKAIQHKPFFPESDGYLQHVVDTISKLVELNSEMDVNEEIEHLQHVLQNNQV